jgi:hypothetical protein
MSGTILAFPIVAGKGEAWRRFCQEMSGSRRLMYEASRLRLGVTPLRALRNSLVTLLRRSILILIKKG